MKIETHKVWAGITMCMLSLSLAFGQKIVNEKTAIAFTQLPAVSLAEDIGSYRPFVALSGNSYRGMIDGDQVANGLQLQGFKKMQDNYDLEVVLWLGDFTITETEAVTIDNSYKDKKTEKMVYRYAYAYKVSVRFPSWIKARTYDGKQVWQSDISAVKSIYTEQTKSFDNAAARNKYWAANQVHFLEAIQRDLIGDFVKQANSKLKKLAYQPLLYTLTFTRVQPKKKSTYTYEAFDEAWEFTQKAVQSRDRSDISTGNIGFTQAIKLWRSEAERHEEGNKKARINDKVASTAYLNCALACIWMNKFELAEEYLALASQLKGGGLRQGKIEKIYNFRKGQFTMYPNWTGTREIAPRAGVATIYQDTPEAKLIAHNQRIIAANNMAANNQYNNGQYNNQTRGSTSNTALGDVVNIIEGANTLINNLNGNQQEAASNKSNPQALAATPAPASPAAASSLSYESLKSPLSASFAATPVGEREKLLIAHAWKLNKIEFINPMGRTQAKVIQDSCLLEEVHQFQGDKQYFITALGACTPEGSLNRQWMSFDYESLIINDPAGPLTLRIIDLNAYIMVIETVTHSNQKPLQRYTYIKAE